MLYIHLVLIHIRNFRARAKILHFSQHFSFYKNLTPFYPFWATLSHFYFDKLATLPLPDTHRKINQKLKETYLRKLFLMPMRLFTLKNTICTLKYTEIKKPLLCSFIKFMIIASLFIKKRLATKYFIWYLIMKSLSFK